MKGLKLLAGLLCLCSVSVFAQASYDLPQKYMIKAVNSKIQYDPMFDYTKLPKSRTSILDGMQFFAPSADANQNMMTSSSSTTTIVEEKKNAPSNVADVRPAHRSNSLVDEVIVAKAAHRMYLMKDGKVIRKFWIALSNKPVGAKRFEGDKKTPEGTYTLDYIKEKSSYYKAFHISYPNAQDIEYARSHGRRPGGMIMVHGQPPSKSEYHDNNQRSDWTNGCIALLNPDLDIFLQMVEIGTPITIKP